MKAVIATTTLYKDANEVRAQLALKTAEEAKKYGFILAVVDGGSPESFCQAMREKGAVVIGQESKGFGSGMRQSFREASALAGTDGVIIRLEAEKHTLVSMLPSFVSAMAEERIDLFKLGRNNRDDYPAIQKAAEGFAVLACQTLTGLRWDFDFGPFLMSQKAVRFFFDFETDREGHEDIWAGCIDVPQLRIIAAGLKVKYRDVDYIHPPEQAAETGREFIIKRLRQLNVQINSYLLETQKLANYFPVPLGK